MRQKHNLPKLNFLRDVRELEIHCILHTVCNMRCKFCFENHSRMINTEYINNLSDKILKVAIPKMKENNFNTLTLSILGGELFIDEFQNDIINLYKQFIKETKDKLNQEIQGSELKIGIRTNGLFKNHKRVEEFVGYITNDLGLKLSEFCLSYDPVDRFPSPEYSNIWLETFNYFKDKISALLILTVLNKPSIYAYLDGNSLIDQIGNYTHINTNYYFPTVNYKYYLPSDDDLYNFYKWGLDNSKFNMGDIQPIIERYLNNYSNERSCLCKTNYYFAEDYEKRLNKPYIINCIEITHFRKDHFYKNLQLDNIDDHNCLEINMSTGLLKRGCVSCEYYDDCPKSCWISILFDEYQVTECPLKRSYKYLDNNPQIIENYKNWKK